MYVTKVKYVGRGVFLLLEGKFTQAPCVPGQKQIKLWPGCDIYYKLQILRYIRQYITVGKKLLLF